MDLNMGFGPTKEQQARWLLRGAMDLNLDFRLRQQRLIQVGSLVEPWI